MQALSLEGGTFVRSRGVIEYGGRSGRQRILPAPSPGNPAMHSEKPRRLLILLTAAATCGHAETTGRVDFPTLAADEDPDSLGVERVGEIVLVRPPREGELPWGTDLYLTGDHALMGDLRGIVHFIDISDPADMRKVAEVRTPGPAVDIKIAGDLAVVGVQQLDADFGSADPRHLRPGEPRRALPVRGTRPGRRPQSLHPRRPPLSRSHAQPGPEHRRHLRSGRARGLRLLAARGRFQQSGHTTSSSATTSPSSATTTAA